ncbi:MAG: LPS biosynthesis-related glycosyltransferase [Herpetosiphonaceae bacterium]|nr:MAG: LPS biosynthesis-related glycosyltransferase [Herpetosiphonaceae bacterium]
MRLRETHRFGAPLPRHVVIIRALRGLGDILCAVPAFRALRAAFSDAHIALIGLPSVAPLISRFDRYLDELIEFPGYPGIPEVPFQPRRLQSFLAAMQDRQIDLALQMHGSGIITNQFTRLLGARHSAGFYLPGHFCPDHERYLLYPAHEPEIRRLLQLLEHLGIPAQGEHLEFPLRKTDLLDLQSIDEVAALQAGQYICIHPGASTAERRWPVVQFAVVADALAAQGLQIVLTGSVAETEITAAVARAMRAPALDLAGKTGLGALAALLARGQMLICNDTGVSHLAAALLLPSVVIFSGSDPDRWAPLDRRRHRVLGIPAPHSGCAHRGCTSDHCCIHDGCSQPVSPEQTERVPATAECVLAEALDLLRSGIAAPVSAPREEEVYVA